MGVDMADTTLSTLKAEVPECESLKDGSIGRLIHVVRGVQVMLDCDLAELYGVDVGAQHAAGPHAGVLADLNVADENRVLAHIRRFVDFRGFAQICVESFFQVHNFVIAKILYKFKIMLEITRISMKLKG